MKLNFSAKSLTLSILSTAFIGSVLVFNNAFASEDIYTDEAYVDSLAASLESGPGITDEQYVASIIFAIEKPVSYTEQDYVNALVEATSDKKISKSEHQQVKQIHSGAYLTSYNK